MRLSHFEQLQPVCPVCLRHQRGASELELTAIADRDDRCVWEGILTCRDGDCRSEFPIIDGVPLLLADLREYIGNHLLSVLRRTDLDSGIQALVAECCGPGSQHESERQQLSTYCWNHYGDFDPLEQQPPAADERISGVLRRGLESVPEATAAPAIDLGCSVGRTTFDLAGRTASMTLGVDVNFSMLRQAQSILRTGALRYQRRRIGLIYDDRRFPVGFEQAEQVDFWACDAMALPFPPSRFGLACSLNLLDSIASPVAHLNTLVDCLHDSGYAVLACPFDWTGEVTQPEGWIGGHSGRAADCGQPLPRLEYLFSQLNGAAGDRIIRKQCQDSDVSWSLRLHDRSVVRYACELFVLEVQARA